MESAGSTDRQSPLSLWDTVSPFALVDGDKVTSEPLSTDRERAGRGAESSNAA